MIDPDEDDLAEEFGTSEDELEVTDVSVTFIAIDEPEPEPAPPEPEPEPEPPAKYEGPAPTAESCYEMLEGWWSTFCKKHRIKENQCTPLNSLRFMLDK